MEGKKSGERDQKRPTREAVTVIQEGGEGDADQAVGGVG